MTYTKDELATNFFHHSGTLVNGALVSIEFPWAAQSVILTNGDSKRLYYAFDDSTSTGLEAHSFVLGDREMQFSEGFGTARIRLLPQGNANQDYSLTAWTHADRVR